MEQYTTAINQHKYVIYIKTTRFVIEFIKKKTPVYNNRNLFQQQLTTQTYLKMIDIPHTIHK